LIMATIVAYDALADAPIAVDILEIKLTDRQTPHLSLSANNVCF